MVVGNHVRIAVFGFVHFEVGVLPGELLARVNGLEESGRKNGRVREEKSSKSSPEYLVPRGTDRGSEDLAEERSVHRLLPSRTSLCWGKAPARRHRVLTPHLPWPQAHPERYLR